MAKHNKWSKIKHRKAVVDKRRGKVWTKISKAIIVAAKHGGPDPSTNLTLRYAIDEARYANMPRDTIERAIKKGSGGELTEDYQVVRYEGYAPGGVAVIVDALTDNRTRTITLVRTAFEEHDGNVGASGCVAYMFQPRGVILASGKGKGDDAVMELAIDAGAADVVIPDAEDDDRVFTILTHVADFGIVKEAVEKAGLAIEEANLSMIPETTTRVTPAQYEALEQLIDALEDLDDVQKVYTNADVSDDA